MIDYTMPSLGADMEDGTLVTWLKRVGDPIKKGDIIAEVETQKGVMELESYNDGVLAEIRVQAGTKVPVGTVLATISEVT
jgi:pyruvate dehydrogenase E2 component (dihydrolipoamide acetyltransferase)